MKASKSVGDRKPQSCKHVIGQESQAVWLPCPLLLPSPACSVALPRCSPADHRSCQPGTCKTPEGHTSCLAWAFGSGSKPTTGSGMTRSASGLRRDFRGLPTRFNAIITMDENRCAKNPESTDYQLFPVLQHPGPRKGKGLTQGHTTPWRQRLHYSVLSQPAARFCVKNPEEGGVKLRRE